MTGCGGLAVDHNTEFEFYFERCYRYPHSAYMFTNEK